MKYKEFIEILLGTIGYEATISGKTEHRIGELMSRYGLEVRPQWRETITTDLDDDYRSIMHRHLGPLKDQRIRLSGEGITWFEDYGENFVAVLEAHGLKNPYVQEVSSKDPPLKIGQVDWDQVGRRIGLVEKKEIKHRLEELTHIVKQSDLDDTAKENAVRHLAAVRELIEAPSPPWEEIVGLLNNPILGAFLNVVGLIQLIIGSLG